MKPPAAESEQDGKVKTVVSTPDDYRCDRFQNRVMETKDWKEAHEGHGEIERVIQEPQPPAYTIATLCCPCGSKHYVIERKDFPQG